MEKDFLIIKWMLVMVIASMIECKSKGAHPKPEPDNWVEELPNVNVSLDNTVRYQVMDGFGFFGAKDVWWGSASNMWDESWGEKVITDLGISIWRSELYPPAVPGTNQDADWNKQRPVVEGL